MCFFAGSVFCAGCTDAGGPPPPGVVRLLPLELCRVCHVHGVCLSEAEYDFLVVVLFFYGNERFRLLRFTVSSVESGLGVCVYIVMHMVSTRSSPA